MFKNIYSKLRHKNVKQKPHVLNEIEIKIYNEGERLIPGITHDESEVLRHRNSYEFFKAIIESDLKVSWNQHSGNVSVVDMGCGVGHGCKTLASIKKLSITGIDCSVDCIEYAKENYSSENIDYNADDLVEFINKMTEYDYVVSRGVFEHIPNGLRLASKTKWRYRLMFDVPYNEQEGNPHHTLLGITEKDFDIFHDVEIFYQDLLGIIYNSQNKPSRPNMIICVCTSPEILKSHSSDIKFPF